MKSAAPSTTVLDRVLFAQANVASRLSYVRVALGASVAALATFGPFGAFFARHPELHQARGLLGWLPALSGWQLSTLRWLTVGSALALALGLRARVASAICAAAFFLLNGYTSAFTAPVFNYDTHLNFFLLLLCACESRELAQRGWWRPGAAGPAPVKNGSFVLGAMQLYVALLYAQAFLAKLLIGGPAWFLSGDVVLLHTLRMGGDFGRWLCQFPAVFPALGVATGLFELTVGWALLRGGRVGVAAALSAIAFHGGTWLVLGISFWHLVVLLPPLFILGVTERVSRPSEERSLSGKLATSSPPSAVSA